METQKVGYFELKGSYNEIGRQMAKRLNTTMLEEKAVLKERATPEMFEMIPIPKTIK